jgi:hypothetical protein
MIENIKISPEKWSERHYEFKYDYISPEGHLYNVDRIENNKVYVWTIGAWGEFYRQSINIHEFKNTWKEHK